MALDNAEVTYLQYIRKQGGAIVADESASHYLSSQLGLSATKFKEMHERLIQRRLIAVAAGRDPFNGANVSYRVSITVAGEAELKRPKQAAPVCKFVWWKPRTWWA
ncbi:MAG TPA: hypothetical protein VG056_11050 [Pirellulales bacterium]|jgi:hypothetical protein|nr:hypothetical protein [Pirellulales bacterium]